MKRYKKILLILAMLWVLVLASFAFYKKNKGVAPEQEYEKIGWVSDIHADRFKKRDVASGRIYPKQYKEYLPKVFDELRKQGIGTVIASGDNTNSGDDNYARDLVRIAKEKKMDVIWVKGNHDNDEVMKELGVTGKNYYFSDYGNTRIVVLDDTMAVGDYNGGISEEQFSWIRESLKTDKQVIVAMHIPIFFEGNLLDRYADLEKMFRESGNIKLVLAGHYHESWQKEFEGISYYILGALTRDGGKGAYATIDLNDASVNYSFAQ